MTRHREETAEHIANNIDELSDAKRAIDVGRDITLYRQPGGCLEINQLQSNGTQDIIHVCDVETWDALWLAMIALRYRVPIRDDRMPTEDSTSKKLPPEGPPYNGPRYPNGAPAMNERNEPLDNLGQVITPLPSGVEGVRIVGIRFAR